MKVSLTPTAIGLDGGQGWIVRFGGRLALVLHQLDDGRVASGFGYLAPYVCVFRDYPSLADCKKELQSVCKLHAAGATEQQMQDLFNPEEAERRKAHEAPRGGAGKGRAKGQPTAWPLCAASRTLQEAGMRALPLAFLLALTLLPLGAVRGEHNVAGSGMASCGAWTAQRRAGRPLPLEEWLFGFLSGVGWTPCGV